VRQRLEKAAGLLASGRGYRKKARCLGAGCAPNLIIALSPLKGYTFLDVSYYYPTFSALRDK
jgi:hypothetical protein